MIDKSLYSLEENYDGEFSAWEGRSPKDGETLGQVIARRHSRRDVLKVSLALSGAALAAGALGHVSAGTAQAAGLPPASPASGGAPRLGPTGTGISFQSIPADNTDTVTVPENYTWQRLLSWGDPVVAGAPAFDFDNQTPAKQAVQAGFNCDFLWLMPLGGNAVSQGLLWNNHEYTDPRLMFRGYEAGNPTRDQVDIEILAHGGSLVEVVRNARGEWSVVRNSAYNRRITGETPMRISGPAAGDPFMRTSYDPSGTMVRGTLNNCGGGVTPWGTILTAEENFNQYFANRNLLGGDHPLQAQYTRYGLPGGASERRWERYHDRFDLTKEPNEPNRFGWIVEIDPYNPNSMPIKRTALGRIKHEAAMGIQAPSGQWVVYSGDDERFECLYKFVTRGTVASGNRNLLDEGTLYVAKFNDDGTGEWLPLVWGQGPLTPANGFFSQADVLIRTRASASALGGTQMDRPEDVEVNPVNRKVYVTMTFNEQRGTSGRPAVNRANPVGPNYNGHIIELTEVGDNHAGTRFTWEVFLVGGDVDDPNSFFAGQPKATVVGFSAPDNILFDRRGNLWIATDGQIRNDAFRKVGAERGTPVSDSIYAVPTAGPFRGQVRRLSNAVPGAEYASLAFNGDDTALFLALQHPGEGSSLNQPSSTFPDAPFGPPRPTVIVVSRRDGATVGT